MSGLEVAILSVLQGATELFPVSSLGHAVLIPALFNFRLQESSDAFVPFLVLLHLGTAGALLVVFRAEWVRIIDRLIRMIGRGTRSTDPDEHLGLMLVVGTLPAAVVAALLESPIKSLFARPAVAAGALIINGGILYTAERLRRRAEMRRSLSPRREDQEEAFADESALTWKDAAVIGFAQVAALVPGISRSGVTMTAGLARNLTHEAAARFSFMLATPIILGAGLAEVPTLISTSSRHDLALFVMGGVLAGVVAYLTTKFLLRYFRIGRLDPFAYYCVAAGAAALIWLGVRH